MQTNPSAAVFAYNHLQSYVQTVLYYAGAYAGGKYSVVSAQMPSSSTVAGCATTAGLPRISEERESAMIQAVGAVAGTERPSLGKVITHLEESGDPAWKNTGAVMRSISEMRLARLCFAPSVGQQIDVEAGPRSSRWTGARCPIP